MFQTNRIVSQRVETSLHMGTHLDGPMHAGAGDIASLPLQKLVHEGVIVEVSDCVEDWSIITPKHPMHYLAFPEGCVHAENVGGDIEKVLNTRCIIGAFPWKFEGGEACPCRIPAFLDVGPLTVEEVRETISCREGEGLTRG